MADATPIENTIITIKDKLPEGYTFAEKEGIAPDEINALRKASNWVEQPPEIWRDQLDTSKSVVGVRDSQGGLIGIGFLVGSKRHAVLCDFVVHPEHRGKGIGTVIFEKRLEEAESQGIRYLYAGLAETNVLKDKYLQHGFVQSEGNLTRGIR